MTTKTVTKVTFAAEIAITFVVVVLSFAILQTVFGMFWESERLGWNLVPVSLLVGGIYIEYLFIATRRHEVLTALIIVCIWVGIFLISASVNEPLHSSIISFRFSIASIIRILYFWGIMEVAEHIGKPIRDKKQAEYMRKMREKQRKDEDSENQN